MRRPVLGIWLSAIPTLREPRFWIASGKPTTRKVARSLNTSAFLGINPTDEPITSGFLVTREQSPIRRKRDHGFTRSRTIALTGWSSWRTFAALGSRLRVNSRFHAKSNSGDPVNAHSYRVRRYQEFDASLP